MENNPTLGIKHYYYIYITDTLNRHCNGFFQRFVGLDYETILTEDQDNAKCFETWKDADEFIIKEIYNKHPLWRLSRRYQIDVKTYSKVDWEGLKRSLRDLDGYR